MKRVFAWLLVLVLCLGMFAGCKKNKGDATTPTGDAAVSVADLEAALEYIKTVYKKPSEKTPKDFQRIGVVPVNGTEYEVVWTADVGEEYIKVVKGTDGMVTIDVNENVEAEVKYVLTATISDALGNSVSHSWNHILPTAGNMLSIVEDAYKLEPGEAFDYEVTLTGKIIAINTPWDAGYKNITVTIVVEGAEDKPIMCYRLKGEGAENLKPNDIITVTGIIKNYNGTIEFDAGCNLDSVIVGEEIKAPEDPKQILKEAYELKEGGALPYKATLTGVISKVNTEYNPGYKNVTVTMIVGGDKSKPVQCYRLAGNGADKIGEGDTITVTGWIVNYKGTVQFGQGCTLDSWKDTGANVPKPEDTFTTTLVPEVVTAPKAGVAYKLFMFQKNYDKNFYLNGEMDGFYFATTYDPAKAVDVFVENVSGGYRLYFMKGGVKNYIEVLRQYSSSTSKYHNNVVFSTNPTKVWEWNSAIKSFTTEVDVDGTKTDFYLGTYSFYKTFSASDVSRITGDDADKMDTENFVARLATMKETKVSAAEKAFEQLKNDYPVAEGASATIENYTRKNVYTIDGEKVTVVWTENSEAVTIKDNGNGTVTVQVTRGEEDAPYKLTATITDGDKKFTASWDYVVSALPKTAPKDIVEAAYALEPGASMADPVTLSGIVVQVNTPYSEQYGNVTVTIVVEDLLDKPIMCYRMKGEGADVVNVGDNITVTGTIKNYNGTIEFDAGCSLDSRKTQAEIVEEVYALESGKSLEEKYTLVGVITSVDTPYSEQYGNVTVTMAVAGDKTIQCYRLKGEGAAELDVGYAIAVFGELKNYNGTYEFNQGCVLVDYEAPADPDEPQMTPQEIVDAAYALEPGAALDGTYTLIGVITSVDTPYSEQFGNVTVTIMVEGMSDKLIKCFRLAGEGADAIAVGDAIMVTGVLKNYNGTIEFDQGCTLDDHMTPAQIVEAAYALETGESFANNLTLTGVITSVDTPFSAQYNNVTVTMAVAGCEDKPIKCYRLAGEGADVIAVGDTITVCGILTNYNGNVQYKQGTVLVSYTKNDAPVDPPVGPGEPDDSVTVVNPEIVTAPQAGVAYKFFLYQKNTNKNLYMTGEMDNFYYATTEDPAQAVDVYLEEVSGGWRAYYMKGADKYYMEMVVSGTHKNVIFTKTPTKTLKWNAEAQTITCDLTVSGATDDYYWGTYSNYKTFSASSISRITGANADLNSNFVGYFATMEESSVSASELAFEQLKLDYPANSTAQSISDNFNRKNVYTVEGHTVDVVWTDNSDSVAIRENGDGTITVVVTRGEEAVPFTLTATISNGDDSYTTSWDYVVAAIPSGEPTTPTLLAEFDFADGSTNAWVDGSAMAAGTATYTDGNYALTFTDYNKVYTGGYDVNNNGFIKFGTSSVVGTLTFTVPEDVDTVVLQLAGYKGNTSKYTINGGSAVTLTKQGADTAGEVTGYDEVTIDTSANKTITLATVSGSARMVMFSVKYYGTAGGNSGSGSETPAGPTSVALFDFADGSTNAWVDGSAMAAGTATYTDGNYTLTFTDYNKVYTGGYDVNNNGFIKFGTSSVVGTLTFTVPEDVDTVVLQLAGYKGNTSKYTINGGSTITLTKQGADTAGEVTEYDEVTIDTSSNKTVTIATVSGSARMVLFSIEYISGGNNNSGNQGGGNTAPVPSDPITNVQYVYGSSSAYSNVIKNWGRRGFNATFLSPNAVSFYADNNVTYEALAAMSGASNVSNVPSSALYTELKDLMTSNHTKQTSYGETRYLYCFTDCQDQDDTAGISCFYSGAKIGPAWDTGATWNREHCWPKSKTPAGDVENNDRGECADLMTLRPVVSSINSGRNNTAYGVSTGFYDPNHANNGAYNVRGDVARIVLYTYVRWGNTSKMWGSAGVIESVDVLLDWMEQDPVDTWEMGRNDSVESVTGTRNVFVDYPELAFVLFGEEIPNMVTPSGKAAA